MTDFYEIGDAGCCLICPDAEEGCLCYNCKCKKCDAYDSTAEEGDYKCDWIYQFQSERQIEEFEKQEKKLDKQKPKTPQKNLFGKSIRKNTKEFFHLQVRH